MADLQCDSLHDVEKLLSHLVYFNGCFLHGSSDHLFKSHDHEKLLATLHALELLLSSVIPFMHHDVEKLLRFQWFFLHGSSDGTF